GLVAVDVATGLYIAGMMVEFLEKPAASKNTAPRGKG
ncbi:30S ribosomal protein S6--L-glutamate ligase, partial [Pseudoalteromonas sp. S4488]